MTLHEFGIEITEGAGNQKVACPKCTPDRKPQHRHRKDLSVNIDKGVWFCHHCGWAGGLKSKKTEYFKPAPVKEIKTIATDWLYKYFEERGISRQTVNGFRVKEHYLQTSNGLIREIAFPFYLGETLYNYKYRSLDKSFRQSPGVEFSGFYNMNAVAGADEIIITEGEIDAMSFVEAGYHNVISVPNGAPNANATHFHKEFKYLDDSAEFLVGVEKFYLAVDMDENGLRLREELARRLGKRKCYIVEFKSGCKDANDTLQRYGKLGIAECVRMASPYPVEGVFAVSDFEEEIREIYRHGYPNGAKTGWSDLDAYYALYPGQLTVCTGVPNSGKSPFMDNLMMNLAENEGWRHAVFSPENGAISNHIIRLIRQRARKNFFPGYNGRCTSEDVDGALSFIMEHFYFVNPDNESYRIDKILDGFEYLVVKHGVRLVLIDPWNTLEHQKPKDESETNYVGRTLNKFKYFARDMGVHFVLVAHPRTPEKYHMNYIPNMYSISGSANWYNIPDVGIIVHRHMSDDKKTTEYNQIIIEKMKFDWVGARGSVKLDFDVASQRFKELERNIFGYHQEPF